MTERGPVTSILARSEAVNVRPWRKTHPPSRILAVRLQAFGDMAITLPYLHALRRLLPQASLDFLTRSEVAELPKALALFDRVFEIGGGRNHRLQIVSALGIVPRLWTRHYEIVIDLQRNRVSRLVSTLLSSPAWSEFDRFSPVTAGERTRRTIEALGLGELDVQPDLDLKVPRLGMRMLRSAGWDGSSELVVLNPAGAFEGRHWPLASYVEFCRSWSRAREAPVTFLLLGVSAHAERFRLLKEAVGERAINLMGTTASEAFDVLTRASLVLSEDSGLMHLASVAGAPTIGVLGASRSAWSRPHGSSSAVLSACRDPDGGCLDGVCRAGTPHCLAQRTASEVVEAASRLLDRVAGSPTAGGSQRS